MWSFFVPHIGPSPAACSIDWAAAWARTGPLGRWAHPAHLQLASALLPRARHKLPRTLRHHRFPRLRRMSYLVRPSHSRVSPPFRGKPLASMKVAPKLRTFLLQSCNKRLAANSFDTFIESGKRRLGRVWPLVAALGQKGDLTEAPKVPSSHPGRRERFPGIDSDPGRFPGTH